MIDYVKLILENDLKGTTLFERMVITEERRFLNDGFNIGPITRYVEMMNNKLGDLSITDVKTGFSLIDHGRITRRDLVQCHLDIFKELGEDPESKYMDLYKFADTNDIFKEKLNKVLAERVRYIKVKVVK